VKLHAKLPAMRLRTKRVLATGIIQAAGANDGFHTLRKFGSEFSMTGVDPKWPIGIVQKQDSRGGMAI
jgi:hypothetical protein